ncbi:MAG: hypothetical protein EBU90_02520 [Proteobacteria bacterium]|nr:hypothetical protein [Pseudomonadota bacterium]NBP13110.1 hypothetical protein [bacterium]
MIVFYLTGLGVTLTALTIWFFGPLKATLGQIFFDKNIYTNDQFETAMLVKYPLLGKLLSCYVCCSFWLSFLIGVGLLLIFNLPCYFPFLTWFTYPCIAYLYKSLVDRRDR